MNPGTCRQAGLIALDWGTTNLRLALLSTDGTVLEERRGESGVGNFTAGQFAQHFDQMTEGWPKLPAVAAGMVGSRQGWSEAGYLACPASTDDLAGALHKFEHDGRCITIVPGLKMGSGERADVMRGEESQIAGFLTENPEITGTLIMPGTHCKWVQITKGTVIAFQTYMTGEIFEAISEHTILRHSVSAPNAPAEDFSLVAQKLVDRSSSIEGALFGLRARHLLRGAEPQSLRTELSALLILAEIQAGLADKFELLDHTVLIGSERLTRLYQTVLQSMNIESRCVRGTGLVWLALHDLACRSNLILEHAS